MPARLVRQKPVSQQATFSYFGNIPISRQSDLVEPHESFGRRRKCVLVQDLIRFWGTDHGGSSSASSQYRAAALASSWTLPVAVPRVYGPRAVRFAPGASSGGAAGRVHRQYTGCP